MGDPLLRTGRHSNIAEINYRTEGEYQACYVILNIASLNVELKVVKSLDSLQESHDWYELKWNDTPENLKTFIERGIAKLPPQLIPPAIQRRKPRNPLPDFPV